MRRKLISGVALAVVLLIGLTIFAFTIPREFHHEKQIDIIAQQRMVFVFIGELKRWVEWTKWAARNPHTNYEYSKPSWGEGATNSWRCWLSGPHSIKVTEFSRDTIMSYDYKIGNFEPTKWQFRLRPAPRQGTTVIWSVSGQHPENRFWRLISYFLWWRLPGDMQKGLNRLKKHAELHDAYDVRGDWET